MSDTQNSLFDARGLRVSSFVLACAVGALAMWILAVEVLRPAKIEFTADPQVAASNFAQRDKALRAARIGLVRGDLWAEAAFAYGAMLLSESKNASASELWPFDQVKALAEQAIVLAPHDARLWLLSAGNYLRLDPLDDRAAASLRMSFYTGPNSIEVVGERLLLSIQSRALADEDFQDLVRHDIQIALSRKSELTSALIRAYRKAPPTGQQFIEKVVADIDPSLVTTIRTEKDR